MKFYVVLSLAKIVAIYAALVCKFAGSKFQWCKFFDKFQVCIALYFEILTSLILSEIITTIVAITNTIYETTTWNMIT